MPVYCYRDAETNESLNFTMTVQQKEAEELKAKNTYPDYDAHGFILDKGRILHRDITSEKRSMKTFPGNWPMFSDALGCGVEQIKESEAYAAKAGVPTKFDKEGRAILTSPAHRKAYARLYGYFDRNAGYGDPVPR